MNIWVMRKSEGSDGRGDRRVRRVLVRVDAITYMSADDHQVRASELGSDEIVVLVDEKDGGHGGPLLPEGFNVDLLDMVSELRRKLAADGDTEDHIVTAQVVDGTWIWRSFAASESEPKPTP
ncbi:hypothetical protein [Streptomyces europaeiscabiei]|uniref:hypothetical protein n=1 Tax=Streptomyces europaeiscabiei TaxID=146819 RepID=UPI000E685993|nr:hypothetical protein [Streptomyces europaeiscabiei]